jgi:hypothetical protein
MYGAWSLEQLIDGCSAHGFTTVGIPYDQFNIDKLFDRDWPDYYWPASEIVDRMNQGPHAINHLGHCNVVIALKLWAAELVNLFNDQHFFLYGQGCLAGSFDTSDCWAEHITVKSPFGAFAAVMNARSGWGSRDDTDGPAQLYNRYFWNAVFNPFRDIRQVGGANQASKEDLVYRINDPCMRWTYYQLNLFGDPTVAFRDVSPCADTDADSVCQSIDNCPELVNPDQLDSDDDGLGDPCDNCPFAFNPDQASAADGDEIADACDNCPDVANPGQENHDDDAFGDACDPWPDDPQNDVDGDSICGTVDNCPTVYNPEQVDTNGDGIGDACCCGYHTDGATGNTDCDTEGRRNLADITQLITRVYLTPEVPLCCEDNGNANGDSEGVMNLTDITRLIDFVYISHAETAPCP